MLTLESSAGSSIIGKYQTVFLRALLLSLFLIYFFPFSSYSIFDTFYFDVPDLQHLSCELLQVYCVSLTLSVYQWICLTELIPKSGTSCTLGSLIFLDGMSIYILSVLYC